MGYEVLDTGGTDAYVPDAASPHAASPHAASPDAASPDAAWPRHAESPAPGRFPRRRRMLAGVVVGTAVVLGLIGGATWTQHVQDQRKAAARMSTLTALALVTGVNTVDGDTPYADLTVQLVNAGPLPLTVVTSSQGSTPTRATPVIRDLGGATTVPAAGTLSVSVRVAVDCTGRASESRQVWVPVRTPDGRQHRVTVNEDALSDSLHYGQAPCSDPAGQSLLAELSGSIAAPLLRLKNESHRELLVTLDVENSPFIAQTANFSVLRLKPALPQTLPAQSTTTLRVALTPWSCPRGLSEVQSSQLSPYVVLRVGSPGADILAEELVGVDLSTLWGAALARDCS